MQWIKASERLPEKDGRYFAKQEDGTQYIYLIKNGVKADYRICHEWLDETESTPSHGRTAEDISLASKKSMIEQAKKYAAVTNGGITMNNPDKYKAFRDGQESGYNQAMEEHRSQPQEGRENIEKHIKNTITSCIVGFEKWLIAETVVQEKETGNDILNCEINLIKEAKPIRYYIKPELLKFGINIEYPNDSQPLPNTVPQEGREEVECTHPYKECVMSDRVNKNGTPLTRCSVCGNDNICDEEVIDDTVNTFTKEDMLAAFCAAEGYVDFDKWLEQYKPYQHTW